MASAIIPYKGHSTFTVVSAGSRELGLPNFLPQLAITIILCMAIFYLMVLIELLFQPMAVDSDPYIAPHNALSRPYASPLRAIRDSIGHVYRKVIAVVHVPLLVIKDLFISFVNSSAPRKPVSASKRDHGPKNSEHKTKPGHTDQDRTTYISCHAESSILNKLEMILEEQSFTALTIVGINQKIESIQEYQSLMFAQMNAIGLKTSDAAMAIKYPTASHSSEDNNINMDTHTNADTVPIIVSTIDGTLPPFDDPVALSNWCQEEMMREKKRLRDAGHDGEFIVVAIIPPSTTNSGGKKSNDAVVTEAKIQANSALEGNGDVTPPDGDRKLSSPGNSLHFKYAKSTDTLSVPRIVSVTEGRDQPSLDDDPAAYIEWAKAYMRCRREGLKAAGQKSEFELLGETVN